MIKSFIPADNPLTVEKVELGKLLFFDPRLSRDNTMSCASCHQPELAWTDGTKISMGIDNQLATRDGMTLVNRLDGHAQLWHGKMSTLEGQAVNPLTRRYGWECRPRGCRGGEAQWHQELPGTI